jgi:hypothetical protein
VAESFGSDAERYDRARPSYPAALVERIVAASPGPGVLDVGCDTVPSRILRATVLGPGGGLGVIWARPRMPALAHMASARVRESLSHERPAEGSGLSTPRIGGYEAGGPRPYGKPVRMLVDALRLAGVGAHAAGAAGLALLRHRPAWRAACCVARHLLQWADYRLSDSGAHEAGFVSEHHGLDAVP